MHKSLYKSKRGDKVVVTTLRPPPDKKKLKVAGGLRNFYRVKTITQLQEVIIMAKSAKKAPVKKKNTEVEDEELEELESIDDVDDLDDEDLDEDEDESEDEDEDEDEDDEDEDEEDEDDEDEEPAPKKGKGKKRQSQAAKNGKVGTNEVAEAAGVDSRTLRMVLRKMREKDDSFKPDSESGRYEWKSLNDPKVKKIIKAIKGGAAEKLKKESLDRLKEKKAAEKAAKESSAKDKTTKKKSKKSK